MQKYYDTVALFNKQTIYYNEQVQQTPKPILEFIARCNSGTDKLFNPFIPNPSLSKYKIFLDTACNEKERQQWLLECFPEQVQKDLDQKDDVQKSLDTDDILPDEYNSAGEEPNDQWEGEDIDAWGYYSE
jgi:hypothetical protein